jgi:hypothetical protein
MGIGTDTDMTGKGAEKWGSLVLWHELMGFAIEGLEGGFWESALDIIN